MSELYPALSGAHLLFENIYPHVQVIWIIALAGVVGLLVAGLIWLAYCLMRHRAQMMRYRAETRTLPPDTLFAIRHTGAQLQVTVHKHAPITPQQLETMVIEWHNSVLGDNVSRLAQFRSVEPDEDETPLKQTPIPSRPNFQTQLSERGNLCWAEPALRHQQEQQKDTPWRFITP